MMYAANQPQLFPPTYMLNRWCQCGTMIFMNEAQFQKDAGHHRTLINGANGPFYLTVSTHKRNRRALNEIEVADSEGFARQVSKTLRHEYGRFPGYQEVEESLETLLKIIAEARDLTLAELNRLTTIWVMGKIGLLISLYDSEILVPDRPDNASEWLALFGEKIGAKAYIAGGKAMREYLDPRPFDERSILLFEQVWEMPPYPNTRKQPETNGYLSALDPILTLGTDKTRALVFGQSAVPLALP